LETQPFGSPAPSKKNGNWETLCNIVKSCGNIWNIGKRSLLVNCSFKNIGKLSHPVNYWEIIGQHWEYLAMQHFASLGPSQTFGNWESLCNI
jgi:hypothetical protein